MDGIHGFSEHRWLSNFWPCQIEYEGRLWPTTEHAYQAAKTLVEAEKLAILQAGGPGKAKRMGRKITLRPDWDDVKLGVMLTLQRLKFEDPKMVYKLLLTGDCYIEETNTWGDVFWGVCNGEGQNYLGQILMQVRQEVRERLYGNSDPQ